MKKPKKEISSERRGNHRDHRDHNEDRNPRDRNHRDLNEDRNPRDRNQRDHNEDRNHGDHNDRDHREGHPEERKQVDYNPDKDHVYNLNQVTLELTPSFPQMSYERRNNRKKSTISWGQRKLLLSEIQFLTLFWQPQRIDPTRKQDPILVYVGAAPGIHLPILKILFSRFSFHLYDPRPFEMKQTRDMHLYPRLFTGADATHWKKVASDPCSPVFFVSDIRTGDLEVDTDSCVFEEKVWQDMLRQQEWVQTIQPRSALLKFRLPYGQGHRDASNAHVDYLDGLVFTQPYAKSTSTETRLVPKIKSDLPKNQDLDSNEDDLVKDRSRDLLQKSWNIFSYENQMFYFNTMERERKLFLHPISKHLDPLRDPELLNDHDSAHEYVILEAYLKKMCSETMLHEKIIELSRLITEALSTKKTLAKLRLFQNRLRMRPSKPYSERSV